MQLCFNEAVRKTLPMRGYRNIQSFCTVFRNEFSCLEAGLCQSFGSSKSCQSVICRTSETSFTLEVVTAFCVFLTSDLSVPEMWFLTLTDHLCGYSFTSLFLRDLSKLEFLFLATCFLNSPLWIHISFVVTQLLTGSWRLKQSRLEMVIWTRIKPRSFLWPNLDFSPQLFVLL